MFREFAHARYTVCRFCNFLKKVKSEYEIALRLLNCASVPANNGQRSNLVSDDKSFWA